MSPGLLDLFLLCEAGPIFFTIFFPFDFCSFNSLSEITGPFLKKHDFFCQLGKMRKNIKKKKTRDTQKEQETQV